MKGRDTRILTRVIGIYLTPAFATTAAVKAAHDERSNAQTRWTWPAAAFRRTRFVHLVCAKKLLILLNWKGSCTSLRRTVILSRHW